LGSKLEDKGSVCSASMALANASCLISFSTAVSLTRASLEVGWSGAQRWRVRVDNILWHNWDRPEWPGRHLAGRVRTMARLERRMAFCGVYSRASEYFLNGQKYESPIQFLIAMFFQGNRHLGSSWLVGSVI
jgi:hypothetical protein